MPYKIRREVYKDKDKKFTWYARVRYRDAAGKVHEKKRTCRTRDLANDQLNQLVAEVESEQRPRKTYADLDRFFRSQYLSPAKVKDGKKISGYKQNFKTIVTCLDSALDHFGDTLLDSITYEHLRIYKHEVEATPAHIFKDVKRPNKMRSVATVNHYLKWLRHLFNIAIEQNWMLVSPFKRGRPLIVPAMETERTRVLSKDEEANLLAKCTGRRKHLVPIIIFAIETACRKGEIMSLTWSQIDIAGSCITITAGNSKTEKSRMVPITSRLQNTLEPLKSRPSQKLFQTGEFQDSFRRACVAADLSDVHFHDLRHTAITRMLEKGIPQPLVMKISGHTNIKTFLRYVNQTQTSIASIARQLDKAA